MFKRATAKVKRALGFLGVSGILLVQVPAHAGDEEVRTPVQTINYYFGLFVGSEDGRELSDRKQVANRIIDELFDLDRLAPQVLQNHWLDLNDVQQQRFVDAFKHSVAKKVLSKFEEYGGRSASSLKLKSESTKKSTANLTYTVKSRRNKKLTFTIRMLKYPDGAWKITDLKSGRESFLRSYYNTCKDTIERFAFGSLIADLGGHDYVVLEDFDGLEIGQLPDGWIWKKGDSKKHKPYEVRVEDGNKYLAAEDNGESVILGKNLRWDLKKYPYISFKWRVHQIPEGGDERYGKTVDSAAGIYLTYKKKFGAIPVSVKFVWSSTLPVGSAMKRSGIGRPWMVVADSGEDHLGEWRTYVFNAYEAYKVTFGGNPPDRPVGIGILSDANSTGSKAYADYDDIRALKHADAGSGVNQKLKAE